MALKRIGIGFTGVPLSVEGMLQHATLAEKRGFDSAWTAEDYFLRDGFSPLACFALATKRIKLGIGIVNPYTRHPLVVAETIATIDELSGGRCLLGLGTGVISLIRQMGLATEKPLQTMRESVGLIRRVLSEKETSYRGATFQVEKVRFGSNPYLELNGRFRPRRRKIPIYMAAMGPKMFQLAGEIADGVLFSVGTPPSYLKYAVENLKMGADKAGRKLSEIDLAGYIACATSDRRMARTCVLGHIAFIVAYASETVLKLSNIDSAKAAKIRRTIEASGLKTASKLVSTEMVRALMAYGNPSEIQERIEEYVSYGLDLPILMPQPPDFRKSVVIGADYARS